VWHAREIVFQSRAALRVEKWLTRHFAERVVAVSQVVASQLDSPLVEVVTDEADPVRFRPGRAGHFRASAGIDDQVPLLGSIGRLDTWKGFGTLLDAYDHLRLRRPEVELVVAGPAVRGKEDYADELRSRAEATPGVHWLGPRRDVEEVMADLDVFVQVSSEPEPFGLVVVEALACGVPVVAGSQGGPLEILGEAAARSSVPAGRLVPPCEPEATALAALALLPRISSTGWRSSRKPLREPSREAFATLFDDVVGGR
jgi:glycosyltransferase involved in cell wall biosynthesis